MIKVDFKHTEKYTFTCSQHLKDTSFWKQKPKCWWMTTLSRMQLFFLWFKICLIDSATFGKYPASFFHPPWLLIIVTFPAYNWLLSSTLSSDWLILTIFYPTDYWWLSTYKQRKGNIQNEQREFLLVILKSLMLCATEPTGCILVLWILNSNISPI